MTSRALIYSSWLALLASTQAFAGLVVVTNPGFNVGPPDVPASHAVQESAHLQPGDSLHFVFTIRVSSAGKAYLDAYGELPVYEVWRTGWEAEKISVGITRDKWESQKASLLSDYRKDGFFTWSTFGHKTYSRLFKGAYFVNIVDANLSNVWEEDDGDGRIEVTKSN